MASSELDQFISVLRDEAYERGHQHGLDEGGDEGENSVASETHPQEKPTVGTRKSAASLLSGVKMILLSGLIAMMIGAMKGIFDQQTNDQISTDNYQSPI